MTDLTGSHARNHSTDLWPDLPAAAFEPSRHLLHMTLQAIGKLKLAEPFHAQWAEVCLQLTARGVTTGPIPYVGDAYEVQADFVSHEVRWFTSSGASGQLSLGPMSVAEFVGTLLDRLAGDGIDASITAMPQEVPNAIAFSDDKDPRPYDRDLVNAWWRILLSNQRVMRIFQGRFTGKTQPVGLMWGTLDIRLPLYSGKSAPHGSNIGFIRRNAMNAELMEMGWWPGDPTHPGPAFYAFTYPQPQGIEKASIAPAAAGWDSGMGEFLLDYNDLRRSDDPDRDLLSFFESCYRAGAAAAGWDPDLLGSGRPE